MKLTEAQRWNLDVIRKAGGTVERDRHGFHLPGDKACIRGMNAVAVRSLVKLGLLALTETAGRDTLTFVKRTMSESEKDARRKWNARSVAGYSNYGGGGAFAPTGSPSKKDHA